MKLFSRRIVWSDVLTFLLFLVLAALIWYGHAMHSVRNTRVPVYVQYTGKPGTIGLGEEGLPDKVMIEVRDAGSRLNSYHQEPLHLTIDLHSYIHGDKGTIHVPSDALRRSISDILQGTSRLIETTPEEITCTYFTEQEKTVVLAFDGELSPAPEYQAVGAPKLSRTKIKVYGQDKTLSTIDTVYTEHIELSDLMDTTIMHVALAVPQGTRVEKDSVDMTVITERFTEKKFKIPLSPIGVPEGHRIRVFPNEVEVNVRVAMCHFAEVQAQDIHATCTYTPDRTETLEVELRYSNPYITSAWAYPAVVEFILEQ
ncbi:MAG: hypothetical protein IKQ50_02325 [Paludibacteraceae bacterium]|nr:hypothetical protein [Paludibacteraceae bacterium]